MPKAVKMKLLSVLVITICVAVLFMSLTMGASMQWGAIALTAVGLGFTFMNC